MYDIDLNLLQGDDEVSGDFMSLVATIYVAVEGV
jgi:hypothetical protein